MADNETKETTEETTPNAETPETGAAQPEGEERPKEPEQAAAEGEEGDGEEAPGDEGAKPEDKGRRRPTGHQRDRARIERLERQNAELVERLMRGGQPPPATEETKTQTPEEQLQAYVRAQAREEAKAMLAERDAEAARQATVQKWNGQLEEMGEDRHEIEGVLGGLNDPRAQYPREVREALLTSEYAPKIIASLLRNPVELARFDALPPVQRVLEIGRLEARLAAGATPAKPKPTQRPPAPPTKTGGTMSSTANLDDLPLSEYKRRLNRSGGGR